MSSIVLITLTILIILIVFSNQSATQEASPEKQQQEMMHIECRRLRFLIQTTRDEELLMLTVKKQLYAAMKKHKGANRTNFINNFSDLWAFYHNKRVELIYKRMKK